MTALRTILLTLLTTLGACAVSTDDIDGPAANAEDLARLSETQWAGSLGYLDYGSGEWASIPVSIRFDAAKDRVIRYYIKYPGETQYNESDKLKISRNGRSLNGATLIERREQDGARILTTQSRGKDDGRQADIRTTYVVSDNALTITKSVKFDGEQTYFRRNAYEMTR